MDFITVEDHELVREGVTKIIEEKSSYSCGGKCSTIAEATALIEKYAEKNEKVICLVDINLGSEDGLDLIRKCSSDYKNALFIAYTMYSGAGIVNKAIEAGAKAYISKNADITELLKAFESVVSDGEFYLETALSQDFIIYSSLLKSLTNRESEVVNLLFQKKSTKEIAEILEISDRTAENYFSRIYDKLGVKDKDALIRRFG